MSEDAPRIVIDCATGDPTPFIRPNVGWKISGRDADILTDLVGLLRWWLPMFTDMDDLQDMVDAMAVIERIASSGSSPDTLIEITASRIRYGMDGVSVSLAMSSSGISIHCDEWVPNVNGTMDSGSILDPDGLPLSIDLDSMGSYDRDRFDMCVDYMWGVCPLGPNDRDAKGLIRVSARPENLRSSKNLKDNE